jgi:hypothetical protein
MAATNQSQASIDLSKSFMPQSIMCQTAAQETMDVLTGDLSDTVIYNTNGAMGCCGEIGNKTWKGPQAEQAD